MGCVMNPQCVEQTRSRRRLCQGTACQQCRASRGTAVQVNQGEHMQMLAQIPCKEPVELLAAFGAFLTFTMQQATVESHLCIFFIFIFCYI